MATITVTNKIKYSGSGYLDEKMGPFEDLAALKTIPVIQRVEGMTVNVLSPLLMECWLVGGTTNFDWRIKQFNSIPTYAKLIEYSSSIGAIGQLSGMIAIGTEATVIQDETNDNKVSKYWVTAKDGATVTWERMRSEGIIIDGEDVEN